MAGYLGYGLKGFAGGFSQGLSMGVTMQEIKWKKKAEEDLLKAKEEAKIAINELMVNPANQEYLNSGIQGDPYSSVGIQLTTSLIALNKDVGTYIADVQKAINEGNHKEKERLLEEFKIRVEAIKSLNLEGASVNPDFGFNISSPEGLKMINMQKTYKETPKETMPYEMTREMAEKAGFKGMPETMPSTPKDLSDLERKMEYANMLNLSNAEKAKIIGAGDSAYEQQVKDYYDAGGTDEGLIKRFEKGAGIDITITPETVGTLATWEERFENITTEAEFNREQNLLTQSKDKFEPEYKTWKEHLVAEVEGMAKALKSYLDEKGNLKNEEWAASFKENVDTYMEKILEIQQKFPDVDLSKFPKFRGEKKSILTVPYGGYIDTKGW